METDNSTKTLRPKPKQHLFSKAGSVIQLQNTLGELKESIVNYSGGDMLKLFICKNLASQYFLVLSSSKGKTQVLKKSVNPAQFVFTLYLNAASLTKYEHC